MTKYNAILIRKNPAWELKCGLTKYVAKFLIAIKDNTHVVEIEAGQLQRPMNAEAGDEIIIDVTTASKNGKTYYNINPFTSYEKSPFPLIKRTYTAVLDELKTLESALSDRTKTPLDNVLKRILHHISEFYHKNYNYVFKEADEA